jgi:hypothetical protein
VIVLSERELEIILKMDNKAVYMESFLRER